MSERGVKRRSACLDELHHAIHTQIDEMFAHAHIDDCVHDEVSCWIQANGGRGLDVRNNEPTFVANDNNWSNNILSVKPHERELPRMYWTG